MTEDYREAAIQKKNQIVPSTCETQKEEWVRAKVLKELLGGKGYEPGDLEEGVPFVLDTGSEVFPLKVSLILRLQGRPLMLIRCGAGSVQARERAALALARIFTDPPIPLTAVTNGKDTLLLDTVSGQILAQDWEAFPDRNRLLKEAPFLKSRPLPENRLEKERRILAAFEGLAAEEDCG